MESLKQTIKSIKENKVIMRILWVVCLVLFFMLFIRFEIGKQARIYYNKGVNYYRNGDYEEAEKYFSYALADWHSKRFECKIRINRVLSITTPITPDTVTSENLEETIETLENARDILTTHDCAHKYDNKGHSRKAEKLKKDIDDYIEYLKEQNPPPEEEDKKDDKSGGESDEEQKKREEEEKARQAEEEKKRKEKEKSLKEQFNQIEQKGMEERNENLELYNEYSHTFEFYDGKSW